MAQGYFQHNVTPVHPLVQSGHCPSTTPAKQLPGRVLPVCRFTCILLISHCGTNVYLIHQRIFISSEVAVINLVHTTINHM